MSTLQFGIVIGLFSVLMVISPLRVDAWVVDNTSGYVSDSNSLSWVAEKINAGSYDNTVTFSVAGAFGNASFTSQWVRMTAELGQQSFDYLHFDRGVKLCGVDAYSVWLGSMEHYPVVTPVEVNDCRFRGYLEYVGKGAVICSNEFSGARLEHVDLNTIFTHNRFAGSSGLYFGNDMAGFEENTFSNCTIDLGSDNTVIECAFDGDCHLILHQDDYLGDCTASGELQLDIGDAIDGGNSVYAPDGDYILRDMFIQGVNNYIEGFIVEDYSFICAGDFCTVYSSIFLHTSEISGGNNLFEKNEFYNKKILVKGAGNTLLNNTFYESYAEIQATGNHHCFVSNVFLAAGSPHPLTISGDSNTVIGCWFGSDPDGTEDLCDAGIQVSGIGTVIGGSNTQARNYFVMNKTDEAIELTEGARQTRIENNWFGLDGNTNRLGCYTAIKLSKAEDTDIQDNVFVATCYGVRNSYFANDTTIQGNLFGTGPDGNEVIPSAYTYGNAISLDGCSNIVIGGTASSDRNIFGNLAVDYPIKIEDSCDVSFCGNYIGVGEDGQTALPNKGYGLYAYNTKDIVVGGTTAESRNIIGNSTNSYGVYLWYCTNVTVMGNYIGLCADGQTPAPLDGCGIRVSSSTDVQVGGPHTGEGNVVAACGNDAVCVTAGIYTNNTIQGNLIGFAADGSTVIPNADCGIYVSNDDGAGQNVIVGGTNSADGLYRAGNVVAGNAGDGIYLRICHNALVEGNHIGVDITGANAPGNDGYGLMVQGGGGNTIRGNLIGGNRKSGMYVNYSPENIIEGNWLGVRANGQAMGNAWHGIEIIDDSYSNVLGGVTSQVGNWIANNASNQVYIDGDTWNTNRLGAAGLVMKGNKIGGGAGGAAVRIQNVGKNGRGNIVIGGTGVERNVIWDGVSGIHFTDVHNFTIGENEIGFDTAAYTINDYMIHGIVLNQCANGIIGGDDGTNYIAHCADDGIRLSDCQSVHVIKNEIIENGADGIHLISGIKCQLSPNRIFENFCMAINSGNQGTEANDDKDPDVGPNMKQNYPIIESLSPDRRRVNMSLNSLPNTIFGIELYSYPADMPNPYPQADEWLGSAFATTDQDGYDWGFAIELSTPLPANCLLTATATSPDKNTSELTPNSAEQTPNSTGPAPQADRDDDNLYDAWEELYTVFGFDPDIYNDPDNDTDFDGVTDLEECIAGTHPGNSNSFLRITSLVQSELLEIEISESSANSLYTLNICSNLMSCKWSHLVRMRGTGSSLTLQTDTSNQTSAYYQVEAFLP